MVGRNLLILRLIGRYNGVHGGTVLLCQLPQGIALLYLMDGYGNITVQGVPVVAKYCVAFRAVPYCIVVYLIGAYLAGCVFSGLADAIPGSSRLPFCLIGINSLPGFVEHAIAFRAVLYRVVLHSVGAYLAFAVRP